MERVRVPSFLLWQRLGATEPPGLYVGSSGASGQYVGEPRCRSVWGALEPPGLYGGLRSDAGVYGGLRVCMWGAPGLYVGGHRSLRVCMWGAREPRVSMWGSHDAGLFGGGLRSLRVCMGGSGATQVCMGGSGSVCGGAPEPPGLYVGEPHDGLRAREIRCLDPFISTAISSYPLRALRAAKKYNSLMLGRL
ncbi:hypothetical protein NDU88_008380 [Pleurodeles waltl]|uniref:Uncharacterized protein n=1 Tax=Pleurodeles waltl TaxID=8319 RepID=A0AAV7SV28_PLEWA|nr:hypothetical protein NDU88_008380 [Pleurodeles waltl]